MARTRSGWCTSPSPTTKNRACGRARDVRDLYDLLSREIPSELDRERFRHLAPHAP
jgi:hypothetical protein